LINESNGGGAEPIITQAPSTQFEQVTPSCNRCNSGFYHPGVAGILEGEFGILGAVPQH